MNRFFLLVLLTLLTARYSSSALAADVHSEANDKPTLRIEEAMRVWQERWAVVSGAGQMVGLKNPNGGRNGISPAGIFSKPLVWPTRLDGTVPGAYPAECFYKDDLTQPNIAAAYVIALRDAIQSCLGATVAPSPGDTGGVILRFDPNWASNNLPWGEPGGPLRASDASRMFRVYYNNAWTIPDINTAPWSTILGSPITIENYEARFLELVNFIKLPMGINSHGTQLNYQPPITVPFTHDFFHPDIYRQTCDSCASCSSCQSGNCIVGPENLSFIIGLGTGANGPVGNLFLYSEVAHPALATPAALDVGFSANVVGSTNNTTTNDAEARLITSLQNGINQPRQIYIPGGLVDIIVDSQTSYTLRLFDQGSRGTLSNGLYVPVGTPHTTIRVENPDGLTSHNRLKITHNNGIEKAYLYTYMPASRSWKLETGEGAEKRAEITTETWVSGSGGSVGDVLLQLQETKDSNDQTVSTTHKKYQIFHWNTDSSGVPLSSRGRRYELIEEIIDPAGKALSTKYRYDETVEGSYLLNQSRRRLKQVENRDGSWERYDYDGSGRVSAVYSSYNNSAPTPYLSGPPLGDYRVVSYVYSSSPAIEARTEMIRLAGINHVVGRSWTTRTYSTSFEEITEEQATESTASIGSPTNLKTISRNILQGVYAGKPDRRVNSDGTVALYAHSYDRSTGRTTTTVRSGVPDNISSPFAATGVVEGTRTITVTNAQGQEVSRQTYDVLTNLLIDEAFAMIIDNHGRVLSRQFMDGRTESVTYNCCGMDTRTDRSGLKTTYTYDGEKRVLREIVTQANTAAKYSETEYVYDTKGRLRKTIDHRAFSSIDGTLPVKITREERQYNFAGQLERVITPLGTTLHSEEIVGGRRQVTTTYPNLSTRIELYTRSGQLESLSGTAVAPVRYEYGVDTDGEYTLEIRQNDAPNTETEWTKSYQDFAGRPSFTSTADGTKVTRAYFAGDDVVAARRGKLKSVLQPADSATSGATGVQTLYDYNALGEVEITALDLNKNGTIDYAGTDRISKAVSDYAQVTYGGLPYTVQRTTNYVWATENSNTNAPISVSEQSVDGLRSWSTSLGTVTTSSVLVYNNNGFTTTTVTQPDATVTTTSSIGGRAQYTTRVHGATQLQRIDYAYDGYGRLEKATDAAHGVTVSTSNGSTIYTYFDSGLVKTVTTPDPDPAKTGPGYDIQKTQFAYDSMGRQETVTHPDNTQTFYRYDTRGQLKRMWGSRTYPQEMSYDLQGRLRTLSTWRDFVDENSFATTVGKSTTTWNYNPQRGWLDNKTYHDNSSITYQYYPSGKLRTRTGARTLVTTYAYNDAGELAATTYSDSTPAITGLTYDRLGRRKQLTDAAGTTTTVYQGLTSLPFTESTASGVLDGVTLTRGYDTLYRPTTLSVPAAAYDHGLTYRDGSRLDTLTTTLQGTTTTHAYTYLANSSLISTLTQKLGATTALSTTRTYDRLNRLVSIAASPSSSPVNSTAYGFNSANQRILATDASGDNWNYGYDSLGQVTAAAKKTSTAVVIPGHSLGYVFDTIGNRSQTTRGTETSSYTLNPNGLNQYASRTVPSLQEILGSADLSASVLVNLSPADRQGSTFIKQLAVNNATAPVWQPVDILASKSTGEVVKQTGNLFVPRSPEDYVYDADGNLTDDGRWKYTWDAENRLISQETKMVAVTAGVPKQRLEYGYDAGGRRIAKKVFAWISGAYQLSARTLFVYDGWNLIAELNAQASNTVIRTYAWGLDLSGSSQGAGGVGGLLVLTGGSATHAPTYDGNGNVIGLVNLATGEQQASYGHGPFGESLAVFGSAAVTNPFRFSTKYTDTETDLAYYGFRYYNPQTGRWLSRDPIGEAGGVNLHGMVGNHPTMSVDDLGQSEWFMGVDISPGAQPPQYMPPLPPDAYIPSWFPRPAPVDLSFLPNGMDGEQRGLWGDYLRNTDSAAADYRKLLDFSREKNLAGCYCSVEAPGATRISGSDSLFLRFKSYDLDKPSSLAAYQALLRTNFDMLYPDVGMSSVPSAPDFGAESTKREFRKQNRQMFDSGAGRNGHTSIGAWAEHQSRNFGVMMNNKKERGNAAADAASIAASLLSNYQNYSSSGIIVRFDKSRNCWFAVTSNNGRIGTRLSESQARSMLKDYFSFSNLPNPLGL